MPKTAFTVCLTAFGVCLATLSIPGAHARTTMGLETVGSYTVQLYITTLTGAHVTHATETTARRSDGARVEVYEGPSADSATGWATRKTISFDDGTSVQVRDDLRIKTTTVLDPKDPEWIASSLDAVDPASDCQRNFHGKPWSPAPLVVEGHEDIRDYNAVRMRFTESNGDVVTVWRAPVLGCEIVQEDKAMRNGTVEHEVPVVLQLGEPDSSMFEIPAGYKETSKVATARQSNNRRRPQALASSLVR